MVEFIMIIYLILTLAAIELPFNNKICSNEVKDFFSKSNIGSIIASFFKQMNLVVN